MSYYLIIIIIKLKRIKSNLRNQSYTLKAPHLTFDIYKIYRKAIERTYKPIFVDFIVFINLIYLFARF